MQATEQPFKLRNLSITLPLPAEEKGPDSLSSSSSSGFSRIDASSTELEEQDLYEYVRGRVASTPHRVVDAGTAHGMYYPLTTPKLPEYTLVVKFLSILVERQEELRACLDAGSSASKKKYAAPCLAIVFMNGTMHTYISNHTQ